MRALNAGLGVAVYQSPLAPPGELSRVSRAVRDLPTTNVVRIGIDRLAYPQCTLRPNLDAELRREAFRIVRARGARLVDGELTYNTPDDRDMKTYLRAFRKKVEVARWSGWRSLDGQGGGR